jgi:polysaccharide export outer membrane protein
MEGFVDFRGPLGRLLPVLPVVIAALVSSAAAQTPGQATATAKPAEEPADEFVIGAEDVLGIVVWKNAEMTGDVTVRPDGMITLPLVGDIRAVGLTPSALKDLITKAAAKYYENVAVTVVVRQINSRKVFITGEVRAPGSQPLIGPRTVLQLIALAGGLTEYADAENITVMRTQAGKTRTFKFNYRDVSRGRNLAQNIELMPGDTVVVP